MANQAAPDNAISDRLMAQLWSDLGDVVGAGRLEREFGSTPSRIWRRGLAGLSGDDLARGLRRLVSSGSAFVPTLGEFRSMCAPTAEELGLPTEALAYRAACAMDWRLHPAVWFAAKQVGVYALRNDAEAKTRPAFTRAWSVVVSRVASGAVFDYPVDAPALEDKRTKDDRRANARRFVAEAKAALGV